MFTKSVCQRWNVLCQWRQFLLCVCFAMDRYNVYFFFTHNYDDCSG